MFYYYKSVYICLENEGVFLRFVYIAVHLHTP